MTRRKRTRHVARAVEPVPAIPVEPGAAAAFVPVAERSKVEARPKPTSLVTPIESFRSPHGRHFVVTDGVRDERWPADALWSDGFAIYMLQAGQEPKRVGTLFRSYSYGPAADGGPRWQASLSFLRWQTTFDVPRGQGYDVGPFDDVRECAARFAQSADEILDWYQEKIA